ncbi:polysaccharide deacetylase family protein [Derxia gummosa]|uniref:Polysaccharide deacetylase family protein n=1 Tax=Derxia gummosa DSM 723 TaxID=1121388 RepID=A0A8B6X946_9BURK|nr:polysaccharide deacetylase family protein [Derxia gummosa]
MLAVGLGPTSTAGAADPSATAEPACDKPVYLTFDTGNMSVAEQIAATLRKHHAKATFFLANERTTTDGWSLGDEWAPFWRARVAEGHAFGTHTFDHVYLVKGTPRIEVQPQFGANAGRRLDWTPADYCAELGRVATRFHALTGATLAPLWRAPGGRTNAATLAAAESCGYAPHVGWADAGFLGDELPSERWSNAALLERALARIRTGDIVMAHLGIWSRHDPFAPMLDPLLDGLAARGHCFPTLREHPQYRAAFGKR